MRYIIIIALTFNLTHSFSQGILFSEYRVMITNKDIKSLQVCNPTEEELTYSLNFIDQIMGEDGKLIDLDSVDYTFSLKKNLKLFPKTIKLLPGECQEVQLQVKNIGDLVDGEYRSYLQFIPKTMDQVRAETQEREGGVSMGIIFRVSPAIPIFFRKNAELEHISLDSIKLVQFDESNYMIDFDVCKKGSQSVFGNIVVEQVNKDKSNTLVEANGVAVYSEIDKRNFKLFIPKASVDSSSKNIDLNISYVDRENRRAKKVLCNKQINLAIPE